jgi:hypothetical protein
MMLEAEVATTEAPRGRWYRLTGRDQVIRGDADQKGSFDLRNSWQVIAGALLIPLGVVFIILGWYGAAHARVEQQQIPYMVSGGFIGLGCMIVGGLLFWGHWLYRVYDQADLHQREQQALLEQLIRVMALQNQNGSLPAQAGHGDVAAAAPASTFYATASGSVYHRHDCPVIANHANDLRVFGPGQVGALRPCQICAPDGS